MKTVVRLSIVDPNDVTRASLKNLLLGLDMVWLEAESSRYEFFADVAVQTQPDIALISLDSDPIKGLDLVTRLTQALPGCHVLVVSSSQEGSLILQAMRNGAKEFLSYPLKIEDFLSALDRIHQTGGGRKGDGTVRSNKIITVAGAGGGVGCTSAAINVACVLAQNPRNSVAIVDLDLALGDADVWLDIVPDYTIQDVAENITRLDYALLKRSLTKHDCGACLLPRPVQLDDKISITPDELRRMIALLKATFTHLVIDVSKTYNPLDMAAMEVSDVVLLIAQLDLPCLRNVVRLRQFFSQHDELEDKIKVIVNRLGLEDTQISLNKAQETIGCEVFWHLPNDYASMVESRNNGVPVVIESPRSKLSKAFEQLANSLDRSEKPHEEQEDRKQRRGLFSFLSGSRQ